MTDMTFVFEYQRLRHTSYGLYHSINSSRSYRTTKPLEKAPVYVPTSRLILPVLLSPSRGFCSLCRLSILITFFPLTPAMIAFEDNIIN